MTGFQTGQRVRYCGSDWTVTEVTDDPGEAVHVQIEQARQYDDGASTAVAWVLPAKLEVAK